MNDITWTADGYRGADWCNHEIARLTAKFDRLREALKECEILIDEYIDAEKPRGVHPKWDSENTHLKELNPARLALEAKHE